MARGSDVSRDVSEPGTLLSGVLRPACKYLYTVHNTSEEISRASMILPRWIVLLSIMFGDKLTCVSLSTFVDPNNESGFTWDSAQSPKYLRRTNHSTVRIQNPPLFRRSALPCGVSLRESRDEVGYH
jgi:hypothetical protein